MSPHYKKISSPGDIGQFCLESDLLGCYSRKIFMISNRLFFFKFLFPLILYGAVKMSMTFKFYVQLFKIDIKISC